MARLNLFGPSSAGNKLRPAWSGAVPDHVISLGWSSDGRYLAAAAVSGPVTIFDGPTGKVVHQLAGHGFGTAAVAWQPGRAALATAGQDGKVRIWDATTGAETVALAAGGSWVERLAWRPDGGMLAASAGKKVRIWAPSGELIRELPAQAGTVTDLAWRPGTGHLAVLAYGAATTYDPATGDVAKLFAWKGSPLALAWSPDGQVLAHGNQDATVHFWYYDTGEDLQMSGYATKVRELAWDSSSRYLANGGSPMACVWDCGGPNGPEGTKPQMLEGHEDNLTALAYQSRGYLLASSALDGRVILWQPANKKAPRVGEQRFAGAEATALAWSPDDRLLAAGASDGTTAVYKAG